MRKIACRVCNGVHPDDAVEEFNERAEELGIEEDDIISMTVVPAWSTVKMHNPKGPAQTPNVALVILYWEKEDVD
jgi:hypothetical protein